MKNKNGIKQVIRFLMLGLFLITVSFGAFAQATVTGKVTDTGGQPLPGVSISIKGTTTGTVSNLDGIIPFRMYAPMPLWYSHLSE